MTDIKLAAGQSWVSPNGVSYNISGAIRNGVQVQVTNSTGVVASSAAPWLWTERKFKNLIAAERLSLYDPTPKLDVIAEALDRAGKPELAAKIDTINADYAEARQPSKVSRDRVQEAKQQIIVLKKQLEEETDPTALKRIRSEIHDYEAVLERELSEKIGKGTEIPFPNPVGRPEKLSKPNPVSVAKRKKK